MTIGKRGYNIVKSVLIVLICVVLSNFARAENSPQQDDVIATVKTVLQHPVLGADAYEATYTGDQKIIHALLQDDIARAEQLVADPQSQIKHKSLFTAFLRLEDQKTDALADHPAFILLSQSAADGSWQEQHVSNLLIANIYLKRGDGFLGLKHAHESLSIVPSRTSNEIRNARFNSYYILNIAYTIDRSPNAVFNSVKKIVEIHEGQPLPFGQFSAVYNLGASFHQASEYSVALDVSKLLLESSKRLSKNDQFIANLSYGRNLIFLKRHQEALPFIQSAIRLAPSGLYETYARVLRVEVLSELGQLEQAQKQINIIENSETYHLDDSSGEQEKILKSKSLIFAGSKEFKQAYEYNRRYADKKIESLNRALTSDRRDLHRRVLLSQELAEKEIEKAELQLVLDKERLERERTLNRIYLILIALAALAISAAAVFIRKIAMLNRKLHIAGEQVKEKSKIKSQLLAMFSHEMLTPLNGIIPLADLLRQSEADTHKQHLLKTIELNGAELTRKIREIILVSNSDDQVNNPVEVNIVDFLQKTRRKFRPIIPSNVEFNVRVGADMPDSLQLDIERLDTITEAILSNSAKYTNDGEVRLSFYMNEDKCPALEITDTGHGMPSHQLEDMIKPFGQHSLSIDRTNQGLGLGLTIVRLQCAIMNAEFKIKSAEDVGTVIHIVFKDSDIRPLRGVDQTADAQMDAAQTAA